MAIARCIETRLREGILALLKADADLFEKFGGEGTPSAPTRVTRIYNGPWWTPDNIQPWQAHVRNVRRGVYSVDTGGISVNTVQVEITVYAPIDRSTTSIATGGTCEWDVLNEIRRIILSSGSNRGVITDPDGAGALNINCPNIEIGLRGPTTDVTALEFYVLATMEVRDNIAGSVA